MPTVQRIGAFAALVSLCVAPVAARADTAQADLVKRGEYLARAGDCFSCHSNKTGAALVGGKQVETPFGTISSPNITPDRETGIGTWSDDDFYRLMHDGIDKQGQYIYPVMPFDHYTKVTREDDLAIKAFLFSLQPVHAPRQPSHLIFPFNVRTSLLGWRLVNFHAGTFQPDPTKSAQINRGAYLVEGLGHCGACHTPRNLAFGSEQSEALGGAEVPAQGWFAPNISSDVREGIGSWSEQQLLQYLKTGVATGKALVAGPMAEVVHTSLKYLTDEDVTDIALYLKSSPPKELFQDTQRAAGPATAYLNNCAFCHQPDGHGIDGAIPPLAGNGAVMAGGPQDMIRTVLGGMPAQGQYAAMPGLATAIPSGEIAQIVNYVRDSFGNHAPQTATAEMVDTIGRTTHTMLAGTSSCQPVGPAPIGETIAKQGIQPLLKQINASNMEEQIDAIVPKMESGDPHAPRADVVNGLTAAYCTVVFDDSSLPRLERVRLLQQFAQLVFSRLSGQGIGTRGGTQHASVSGNGQN